MNFVVYQCTNDPEDFIVTDDAHKERANAELSATGEKLKEIGTYGEMGDTRAAFDESLARAAIEKQGYYKVHAEHLADLPITPEMPG